MIFKPVLHSFAPKAKAVTIGLLGGRAPASKPSCDRTSERQIGCLGAEVSQRLRHVVERLMMVLHAIYPQPGMRLAGPGLPVR